MDIRDMEPLESQETPPRGIRIAAFVRWVLLAIAVLAAVGTIALAIGGPAAQTVARYHCPMHPTVVSDQPRDCPICGMDLVPMGEDDAAADPHHHDDDAAIAELAAKLGAREGQWICPMESCAHVADEAGRCPVCGMALVLVPRGDAAPHRPVPGMVDLVVSPERLARIGVRTAPVEQGRLSTTVRTVGVIAPAEDRLHRVQARFSGWVQEVFVSEVGVEVRAGQPLASVFSPELHQAQIDYLNAIALGGAMRQSARRRLELLGIAPTEIARIERRGVPLDTLVLRAPADGHVIEKGIVSGVRITPETTLYAIADLSRVWIYADLYQGDLGRVRVGAKARFRGHDGAVGEGEVAVVTPVLDPHSRTARARIRLPNADRRLRPGGFGEVEIEAERFEAPLVPRDAVIETGTHSYVIVARGGGRFAPRRVEVLGRSGDRVAVEGVRPGETVVERGGFFLDAESRLRAALPGGGGHGEHAHD